MSALRQTVAAALLTLVAAGASAQQAETVTVDAFSIWHASGAVLRTGPAEHRFAGEMRGPYFVDVGEGPIPAGEIACIGAFEVDEETGRQQGSADCRLTASDGAVAFAGFTCEGYRLVGCRGAFAIAGGEGRLAGASGEGEIVVRRYGTELSASPEGAVTEMALGVASWKGLTLRMAASQ